MRVLFACALISLAFLSGCYYDSKENLYPSLSNSCSDTTNVTYSAKIAPILGSYCTSCHSGSNPGGNVKLDTYTGVKTAVDNQNLLSSIKQDGTVPAMPQSGGKLDNCQITAFSIWIKAGAPNN